MVKIIFRPLVALLLLMTIAQRAQAEDVRTIDLACNKMPDRSSYGAASEAVTISRVVNSADRTISVSAPELGLVQTTAYGPASGSSQITVIDTSDGIWGYFDAGDQSMTKITDLGGWVGIALGKYGSEFRLNRFSGELSVEIFNVSYSDYGRVLNLQNARMLFSKNTYKCLNAEPLW